MSAPWYARPGWQNQPGLHALVVGISQYANLPDNEQGLTPDHLGMIRLKSPALTAFRMAALLRKRAEDFIVPLATCRVLLAPSPAELEIEPALDGFDPPDFVNFSKYAKAWRTDAMARDDGMTVFFFAGHGLQREKNDHVLVLHNFNDGIGGRLSQKGVVVNEIVDGMAASAGQEKIARTQLYFFDTCRVAPEGVGNHEIMQIGSFWDIVKVPAIEERLLPSFFSSKPGWKAFAKPGVETIFGGALLKCFEGGAGVPINETEPDESEWVISLESLRKKLNDFIDLANREEEGAQRPITDHIEDDFVLMRLEQPPEVSVTLRIDPSEAAALANVTIIDVEENVVSPLVPFDPNPMVRTQPAGFLRIRAVVDPEHPDLRPRLNKVFNIRPPAADCPLLLARK